MKWNKVRVGTQERITLLYSKECISLSIRDIGSSIAQRILLDKQKSGFPMELDNSHFLLVQAVQKIIAD